MFLSQRLGRDGISQTLAPTYPQCMENPIPFSSLGNRKTLSSSQACSHPQLLVHALWFELS